MSKHSAESSATEYYTQQRRGCQLDQRGVQKHISTDAIRLSIERPARRWPLVTRRETLAKPAASAVPLTDSDEIDTDVKSAGGGRWNKNRTQASLVVFPSTTSKSLIAGISIAMLAKPYATQIQKQTPKLPPSRKSVIA